MGTYSSRKIREYFGASQRIDSLLEILLKVDENKIDFERSKLEFKSDQIYIELFGIGNRHCPLNIVLGICNKALNKITMEIPGVQNIFYYDDTSKDDYFLKHVQHTFKILISEDMIRRDYFINDKCCKTELICSSYELNSKKDVSFQKTYKLIWFWQKPKVIETKYFSWI